MSIRDIPDFLAFDLLSGSKTPYDGFGEIVKVSSRLEMRLRADAVQVRNDIRDGFGAELRNPSTIPEELDQVIERMWGSGWDPRVGDLALFTREFGLLLMESTLDLLGGKLIFRSPNEGTNVHNSIFWPEVEAFPYHKAFKCLTESDGDSMAYFVRGVGRELEQKGLLKPGMKERLPAREPSHRGH